MVIRNNAIIELNNTLQVIKSRLHEAEGRMSVLEDKVEKTISRAAKRKKTGGGRPH